MLTHELTHEDALRILRHARYLLRQPDSIVAEYDEFATDQHGEEVRYGDPAACRFCCAGVLNHAASLEGLGSREPDDHWSGAPLTAAEQDFAWGTGAVDHTTPVGTFALAWQEHIDSRGFVTPDALDAVRGELLDEIDRRMAWHRQCATRPETVGARS